MAKLSSREKKAKALGGTLNYKTGKISVPSKQTYKAPAKSTSSQKATIVGYDQGGPILGYAGDNSPSGPSNYINNNTNAGYVPGYEVGTASDSKKKSQSKTPTRTTAAPAYNGFGSGAVNTVKNFVNTAPQRVGNGGGYLSGLINKGAAEAGGLWDTLRGEGIGGTVNQLGEDIMLGMRNAGGIFGEKAQAMELPLAPGISINDRGIIQSDPTYPDNPNATPSEIINQGRGPINVPGVTDTGINTNTRTPKPTTNLPTNPGISNPFNISSPFIPESSGISSAYQPDFSSGVDNGTVQRPVGQGQFSNGQFGNGSGGYGLAGGGIGTGTDQNNPMDDLMIALGLKTPTAQAETLQGNNMVDNSLLTPMGQQYWGTPQQPYDYLSSQEYADTINSLYGPGSKTPSTGDTGGISNGGVSNVGQAVDPTQSYIQSQIASEAKQAKAQEKALKELIKSIKSQYNDAVSTGTTDMEKAKQEDLLKLSGLLNNSNQDYESGQSQQYNARMQQDYSDQMAKMLKDLKTQKDNSIKSGQSNYEGSMQTIKNAKAAAQYKLAMLLYQAQKKKALGYDPGMSADEWALANGLG